MLFVILTWVLVVLATISLVGGPFLIGKPRDEFTAFSYLVGALNAVLTLLVCGRVLGWW